MRCDIIMLLHSLQRLGDFVSFSIFHPFTCLSVYQKPTFTGLLTNFHSFIPLAYKKCLILTLLNRYFRICSAYENFCLEVEKFRDF